MAGCNNNVGRCDKNNCQPKFSSAWSLIGYCSAGKFKDCPCDKCNGQTDKCNKNGCEFSSPLLFCFSRDGLIVRVLNGC